MNIKSQKDFFSGLMFMGVGVAFAWGATTYSFGSSARAGPAHFPFGVGVIMAILGALVVMISVLALTREPLRLRVQSGRQTSP